MPTDKEYSTSGTASDEPTNSEAPNRHPEYYFAMTIFLVSDNYDSDQADWPTGQVENELFKVPRQNFAVQSEIFSDMFQLPGPADGTPSEGSSDDRPIRLDGIKKSDFIQLLHVMFPLWVIHSNRHHLRWKSCYHFQWFSIMRFAEFKGVDICSWAINHVAIPGYPREGDKSLGKSNYFNGPGRQDRYR